MVMAAVTKSIGYEFPFANTNDFQVLNCTSWLWYVLTLFPHTWLLVAVLHMQVLAAGHWPGVSTSAF